MTTTARRLRYQRANDIVMMMTMITMTTATGDYTLKLRNDNDFVEGQKQYSNDLRI